MAVDLENESSVMIFSQELVFGFVPRSIKGAFQVDGAGFTAVDDNFLSAFWDRLNRPGIAGDSQS